MQNNKLIVIIGPTASGKTAYAVGLATQLGTEIISADSRQVYQGLAIGTAAPTPQELAQVKHHLVLSHPLTAPYSASTFVHTADHLLTHQLFPHHHTVVMVGGSTLYLKAFLEGLDPIPPTPTHIRNALWAEWQAHGVEPLRQELQKADPLYLQRIDPHNHKRIIRALEVYRTTGKPFSSFHSATPSRCLPYQVEIHYIERPRPQLYQRIDERVEQMFSQGLVEEAKNLLPYRHLNALNTIGYKEVFAYLDGQLTLPQCQQLIQKNTRTYARQQQAYFRRWAVAPTPPFPLLRPTLT